MLRFIKIEPFDTGSHDNYTTNEDLEQLEGRATIPDDMQIPDTFPFVDIVVKDGVVTKMTPKVMPEQEQFPVSNIEQIRADIDYIAAMTGVEL